MKWDEYVNKQREEPCVRSGEVFEGWTVVGVPFKVAVGKRTGGKGYKSKPYAVCECRCGVREAICVESLKQGTSTQCMKCRDQSRTEHGMCDSAEYSLWKNIKTKAKCLDHRDNWRCYNHVDMDPRWEDFKVFYADVGDIPEGMTCDRIDNLRGYWPDNIRWATPKQQAENRRTQGRPAKPVLCV